MRADHRAKLQRWAAHGPQALKGAPVRRFGSHGPVNPAENLCVACHDLAQRCVTVLVGAPGDGGHHLAIWAPRQTGTTWILRRAIEGIRERHDDRFAVGSLSMPGVVLDDDQPEDAFFPFVPDRLKLGFGVGAP